MTSLTIPVERHRAPEPRFTYLVALALACAVVAMLVIAVITARHEARQARQDACAAELRAALVKTPTLRPIHADPCEALRGLKG